MPKNNCFDGLNRNELIDAFCEIFENELDSWFSADIACCDECYDEFVTKWPRVYFRDLDFQRSYISIDSFYSGSDLQHFFTQDECREFIQYVHCPHCKNSINYGFWPFNFKFDLPESIEDELEKISKLAESTPFLILTTDFARKTLKVINNLADTCEPTVFEHKYYRARKYNKEEDYRIESFRYPPKDKIYEGRYNHAGHPVIYLGDSEKTCFAEMRNPVEGIVVATISITKPLKVLDLFQIEDDNNNVLNIAAWSSLMSSQKEGDGKFKPHYAFTRFIADCAFFSGFDAIKYPSVRSNNGHNLVLLNGEEAWKSIEITDAKTATSNYRSNLSYSSIVLNNC